jgi:hypothetical protein
VNGSYAPLDTLTPAHQAIFRKYDAAPYVSGPGGAVPFVMFGNRALMSGSTFSPALLKDLNQDQIGAALSQPESPVAKAVLGAANAFTTVLCGLTNQQPAAVCSSPAATAFPEVAGAKS